MRTQIAVGYVAASAHDLSDMLLVATLIVCFHPVPLRMPRQQRPVPVSQPRHSRSQIEAHLLLKEAWRDLSSDEWEPYRMEPAWCAALLQTRVRQVICCSP